MKATMFCRCIIGIIFIWVLSFVSIDFAFAQSGTRNFPELTWKTFETEHFVIHYYPQVEWTARKIAKYAEIIYPKITEQFQYPLQEKTHIVVRDQEDNANGFAAYTEDWITIWANNLYYRLRGRQEWIPNVVTHEFAHIVSLKANDFQAEQATMVVRSGLYEKNFLDAGGKFTMGLGHAPFWWSEGGAQYWTHLAGKTSWTSSRDMLLRMSILEDNYLDYTEWQTRHNRALFGTEQVYNQGYSMGLYLMKTYGKDIYAKFALNSAKKGHVFWENNIKNVLGIDGKTLFQEWLGWLKTNYEEQIASIRENKVRGEFLYFTKPSVRFEDLLQKPKKEKRKRLGGNLWANYPRFSPDGTKLALAGTPGITVLPVSSKELPAFSGNFFERKEWQSIIEKKVYISGLPVQSESFGFSPDGNKLVLASQTCLNAWYGCYDMSGYQYNDLYIYDLTTKKETRISKHLRAQNPSWSPDDSDIAFIRNVDGQQWLGLIKPDGSDIRWLIQRFDGTQIDMPSWSPDSRQLVFSLYKNGQQNIWIANRDGSDLYPVTWDDAEDKDPIWSQDGESIYFSSDRTGIFNIYRLELSTGTLTQITNVISGAFAPFETKEENLLYVHFTSYGFKYAALPKEKFFQKNILQPYKISEKIVSEYLEAKEDLPDIQESAKPYKFFRAIKPPTGIPLVVIEDLFFSSGAAWSWKDYVEKHKVFAQFLFGGNQSHLVRYENHQWYPTLYAGAAYNNLNRTRGFSLIDELPDTSDIPIATKLRFGITQFFAGSTLALSPRLELDGSFQYRALSQKDNADGVSPEIFLQNQKAKFRLQYEFFRGGEEKDVHPRKGRKIDVSYAYQGSKNPSSLSEEGVFDRVEAIPNQYAFHEVMISYLESISLSWLNRSSDTLDIGFQGAWLSRNVLQNDEIFAGTRNPLSFIPDLNYHTNFPGYGPFALHGETLLRWDIRYRFPVARRLDRSLGPIYLHGFWGQFFGSVGNLWSFTCEYRQNQDGSIVFAGDGKSGIEPSLEQGLAPNTPICQENTKRREIPFFDIANNNGNLLLASVGFDLLIKANLFNFSWNSVFRIAYPLQDIRGLGDLNGDGFIEDSFPENPLVDELVLKFPRISISIGSTF